MKWTAGDYAAAIICVITVLYIVAQIVRWAVTV